MPTDRVVLDTNSLLSSLARRGSAYPVWKGFQEGRYTLCVTTEILEEYEEVIARKTTATVAENVLNTILKSENVMRIDPHLSSPHHCRPRRGQVCGLCLRSTGHLHRFQRHTLRRAEGNTLSQTPRAEAKDLH